MTLRDVRKYFLASVGVVLLAAGLTGCGEPSDKSIVDDGLAAINEDADITNVAALASDEMRRALTLIGADPVQALVTTTVYYCGQDDADAANVDTGNGNFTIIVDDVEPFGRSTGDSYTTTYNKCVRSGRTLNGSSKFTITKLEGDPTLPPPALWQIKTAAESNITTTSATSVRVEESKYEFADGSTDGVIYSRLADGSSKESVTRAGKTITQTNAFTIAVDDNFNTHQYKQTIKIAKASAARSVLLETPAPLVGAIGTLGGAPDSGSIKITRTNSTGDKSITTITALADGKARVEVDRNGDGVIDSTTTVHWSDAIPSLPTTTPPKPPVTPTPSPVTPAPAVTLTANPTTVVTGDSSTLTWSTTNATSCSASGAWSGTMSTSGTQASAALTAIGANTFTLTCAGAGGSSAKTATVTVTAVAPAPTVLLTATPTTVVSGGNSTLTWASTNATTCTATGAWSGGKAVAGNEASSALTGTSTFTLTCTGAGGSASGSATVTVTAVVPPVPTVTLTASPSPVIITNARTYLTWSSTNATTCAASGAWSGVKSTSGNLEPSGLLTGPSVFTLTCTGAGGSAASSVTVYTDAAPPTAPIVSLSANPTSVVAGGSAMLTWSTNNVTVCTASGAWSGTKATSGTESSGALTTVGATIFTLTCTGPGGTKGSSATVTVTAATPAPKVILNANPTNVANGDTTTLSWAATNATTCTASGQWIGDKATSGTEISAALTASTTGPAVPSNSPNKTFTLTCVGPGGSGTASTIVTVGAIVVLPVPNITISANPTAVLSGGSSTLTWSTSNATGCNASGAWSGAKAISGTEPSGLLNSLGTNTFTLVCTGVGGSSSSSATVTVTAAPPAPTVTLTASPTTVVGGFSSTLTWSSTNATTCTATGAWSGLKAISESVGVSSGALTNLGTNTFTLTCTGAGGSGTASANVTVRAPGGGGQPVTISFIEVNDLHAHLTPHADLDEPANVVKVGMRGGFARLATAIKAIRADNPLNVVMNVGDTFHGGIEAMFTEGNAIVAPVNALGFDVGVPGNWDFAYGPIVTRSRYAGQVAPINPSGQAIVRPNFVNLAANAANTGPAAFQFGAAFLPPTWEKTIGGVKVGFIGITSDIVQKMSPLLAVGFSFTQGQTAYRDLINRHANTLRAQGAKIVVVMSELGLHKDHALANLIQAGSVDVFFSAHTHELTRAPLTSTSGALVVEPGNDGYIGRMDITVAVDGTVVDRQWRVIVIDNTLAEDATMKALVDAARAPFLAASVASPLAPVGNPSLMNTPPLTRSIATVLGKLQRRLDRHHALENSLNNAVADIMRSKGGSQVAFAPGFRFDTVDPAQGELFEDNTVASGDITVEDVFRFFPVPANVATGSITGAGFRQLLEQNLTEVFSAQAFNHAGGWAYGYSGLEVTLDLAAADGARISSLALKGATGASTPIAATDTLTVTACQRPIEPSAATLCSVGGFSNVAPLANPAGGIWTLADLFADAIEHGALPGVRANITDTSNTPLWPVGRFFQPFSLP